MNSVYGTSNDPNISAVFGDSSGGAAVWGNQTNNNPNASAVLGTSKYGVGVWGKGGRLAGMFEGHVAITGELQTRRILVNSQGLGFPCVEIWQDGLGDILAALNQNRTVFSISNTGGFFSNSGGDIRGNVFVGGYLTVQGDIYGKGVNLTSDKNAKENFSDVNALQVLDKLASMPIQSWNYKEDKSSERHIGPTAQDFHDTFGLSGADNKYISSIDIQGVALAAIQGLNEKNEKLVAENVQLHTKLANLEARLSALEFKD
ncbi:tail fiber domain-containing protein [Bacillus thuringiensis]|uniref:tail fiber domain-containing protein n=1 Tax=Bacillus thuringiensis TaxID=1428 RepID=UPI000BF9C153|nr:tail fiber domain-containing protein [Bacillus thuringiensis]PFJ57003.1 hypothetical protein COJ10_28135 [Bacillus thuringiensis]